MANEENLIPFSERSKSEARENGRKGGKASGRARRKKANFKKATESILQLELPPSEIKAFLEKHGIEPTFENGVIFSTIFEAIKNGDINAVMKLREITEQHRTLADRREQKARTDRLQAETERIREESDRKSGRTGQEQAEAQTRAIADMINNPQSERVLSDFLGGGKHDGDPNSDASADPVQPAEQEAD